MAMLNQQGCGIFIPGHLLWILVLTALTKLPHPQFQVLDPEGMVIVALRQCLTGPGSQSPFSSTTSSSFTR